MISTNVLFRAVCVFLGSLGSRLYSTQQCSFNTAKYIQIGGLAFQKGILCITDDHCWYQIWLTGVWTQEFTKKTLKFRKGWPSMCIRHTSRYRRSSSCQNTWHCVWPQNVHRWCKISFLVYCFDQDTERSGLSENRSIRNPDETNSDNFGTISQSMLKHP